MKRLLATLLIMFVVCPMMGAVLKGTVKDETGSPLWGATIVVDGYLGDKCKYSVADEKGRFKVSVSKGEHEITIRMVGYETIQEILNISGTTRKDYIMYIGGSARASSNSSGNQPVGPNNKARVCESMPLVGPVSGEFYVGRCAGNPIPGKPPVTNRDMNMVWEFDPEKGYIIFSHIQPQGGGYKMVHFEQMTIALENGHQIKCDYKHDGFHCYYDASGKKVYPKHQSFYTLYLPNYKDDRIVVSWINAPEQTGVRDRSGYFNNYQDHVYYINYALPINVKEAKDYHFFIKAKKGSLKDAINYVKNCSDNQRKTEVENEIVNSKTNTMSDVVYCNDNYPKLSDRLEDRMYGLIKSVSDGGTYLKYYTSSKRGDAIEDKMFGLINSLSDCEAYMNYFSASKRGAALDDKTYQYVKPSAEEKDCETYLKLFPQGKHQSEVVAQKNEIASYNEAINGGKAECTAYLNQYPNGRFASKIQSKIDDISRKAIASGKAPKARDRFWELQEYILKNGSTPPYKMEEWHGSEAKLRIYAPLIEHNQLTVVYENGSKKYDIRGLGWIDLDGNTVDEAVRRATWAYRKYKKNFYDCDECIIDLVDFLEKNKNGAWWKMECH